MADTALNDIAQKKANVVQSLNTSNSAKEYVKEQLDEFGIMMCGSARVGKSTLINALCKRELAGKSPHLNAFTQAVTKYPLHVTYQDEKGRESVATVNFWDTPGIENWNEESVKFYVLELVDKTKPICMIYCASPGSLANLKTIKWICDACAGSKIFFALVCTNMFAGTKAQRDGILDDFKEILANVAGNVQTTKYENIHLSSKIGLVAAVNSEHFDNGDGYIRSETGVNELCMTIMEQLDEEKLKGWCITLLDNRDFWTKMSHDLQGFFKEKFPVFLRSARGFINEMWTTTFKIVSEITEITKAFK